MENRLCTVAPPLAIPRVRVRRLPRLVEVDDPTLPREAASRPALSDEEAAALVRDEEPSHPISAVLPRRSPTLVGVEPEPESLRAALAAAPLPSFVDEPVNALAPAHEIEVLVEPLVEVAPRPAEPTFAEVDLAAPVRPRSRGVAVVLLTFAVFVAAALAALLLAGRSDLVWPNDTGTLRQVTRGHRADVLRDVRGTRIEALPTSHRRHR